MRSDEPLTIDGRTCAETLTRHGYERQAAWCRDADTNLKTLAARHDALRAECDAMWERLQKYEPREEHQNAVRWTGD